MQRLFTRNPSPRQSSRASLEYLLLPPALKDLVKVIQQESYSYRDPITELLEHLYVNFDFDGARQNRYGPPSGVPLTSTGPGLVHHLSGPNIYALRIPNNARLIGNRGTAVCTSSLELQATLCFHCAARFSQPNDSHTC